MALVDEENSTDQLQSEAQNNKYANNSVPEGAAASASVQNSMLFKAPKIVSRFLKKKKNENNGHSQRSESVPEAESGVQNGAQNGAPKPRRSLSSSTSRTTSNNSTGLASHAVPLEGCREGGPPVPAAGAKTSQESAMLFKALCNQRWSAIGQPQDRVVAATDNTEIMIDRITSILEHRLSDVIRARQGVRLASANGDSLNLLDGKERRQLHQYVSRIASLYRNVLYHSFEHASHVVISVNELIEMLRSKQGKNVCNGNGTSNGDHQELDRDPGTVDLSLVGDPYSHFALLFAALVHDVDHYGMSNQILIDRKEKVAARYNNNAVAERNSLDIALRTLSNQEFDHIRTVIFPTVSDKVHFGKLIFDTILCTDIASKERMKMCKGRWEQLFEPSALADEQDKDKTQTVATGVSRENCPDLMHALDLDENDIERYASFFASTHNRLLECVVMEHMVQVADVAHTMQGWENFIKWNYRLYKELMACFKLNLAPDPTTNWYSGQIGFFDFYVIPLATRMDQCAVLGDNGKSLINFAKENKERWKREGERMSHIMACGVQDQEDEKLVLSKCFQSSRC